jgi:hypothetical protein
MGISIAEFRVAMETYGAKRLPDREDSVDSVPLPCFVVGGVQFLHSGQHYIVQRGNKVPDEIMDKAMEEFGEEFPGSDNFLWDEIYSIKGILTLVAMLEGRYSKKLVDELANTTYKKLLKCPLIQTNVEFPFQSNQSPKMEELYQKLAEYSNIVNPFGNDTIDLKEPIDFDGLKLSIASKEGKKPHVLLVLGGRLSRVVYANNSYGWSYDTSIHIQKNGKNGYIQLDHFYINGNDRRPDDEVIWLDYSVNRDSYAHHHPDDIDLSISLKTGLAWHAYNKEQATPATDEQVDIMITYLNVCIKEIKKRIIRYMDKQA